MDWPSVVMVAAALSLASFAWVRLRPPGRPDLPRVGAVPPPLRLLDPETAEPVLLVGLRGKVVWVSFWRAGSPGARAFQSELERVGRRFDARRRFSLISVAVDRDDPEAVRAASAASRGVFPLYLATRETMRSYGIAPGRLPLHLLLDEDGRVGMMAQGNDPETLARVAREAEQWLDALEPFGGAHFAALRSPGP